MFAFLREKSCTKTEFVVIGAGSGRVRLWVTFVPRIAAVHVASNFNCCSWTAAAKFFGVFSDS